ncbi:MAG: peptide ABC transporter substrate-binding protein [Planctomycetes bacterium]|nr:peptide ABC transporter substrate-binding protein [Planctomycetota bacterium]
MPRGLSILLLGPLAGLALLVLAGHGARLDPPDFAFVNPGEVASLDPASVTGVPEMKVLRFLYEGLLVEDPDTLEPRPGVARSWEVSPDGLRYTFHLREDARWSNGDPLTAEDFVYSFRRLLDPRTAAAYAYQLWYVKGARAFTSETGEDGAPRPSFDTVGIRASDALTLLLELEAPTPFFLGVLASVPLMPVCRANLERVQHEFGERWRVEWTKPAHFVGNGPYRLALRRVNDRLRFVKSATYWDARSVALETVDCLCVEHLETALNLYLTHEVGWIDNVPTAALDALREREDFQASPYLASGFYRFNTTQAPFDDPRVRRALALCVDREAIAKRVLRAGEAPNWGFLPPAIHGARPGALRHGTRAQDLEEARALLAQAGYGPGARALPPVEILFATQSTNKDVAEVVADGWRRELGVESHLLNQEARVALDSQRNLRYEVSRSSWVADHTDALGFLEIFESGSENNRTGWSNARYDELLAQARRARDPERARLLEEAEALLLEELPILPLWSFVTRNLVDPRLAGFGANELDEHFPKFWHWRSAGAPR